MKIQFTEEVEVILDEAVPEGEAWLCVGPRVVAKIAGLEELIDGDEAEVVEEE